MKRDVRLSVDRLPFSILDVPDNVEGRYTKKEIAEFRRAFALRLNNLFRGEKTSIIARQCKSTQIVINPYLKGERFPTVDPLPELARVKDINLQ